MIIKLTVPERLYALQMLNTFKGSLDVLTFILDDLKKIRLNDEEVKEFELATEEHVNEKGEKTSSLRWNPEKDRECEVEMSRETIKYLADQITQKSKSGEYTVADAPVLSLNAKLK